MIFCIKNYHKNINSSLTAKSIKHFGDYKVYLINVYKDEIDRAGLDEDMKYDLIFIDGLHLSEQVDKDIENSLKHLSEGGTIVMHDCLPEQEANQFRNPVISQWTGDVWKSVAKIRTYRDDITVDVVDTDWGCGILRRTSNVSIS